MSDIVLSASVRQNLLSLQSTADLLATTQGRLATGKKVNSALDNPTNYFTAASLDARASDINNLLDGIGNGVQVLQAANTGITSLQKLIDSAKSVANQALQTNLGFTKSFATGIAVPGATATNLLGTLGGVASTLTGAPLNNNHTGAGTAVDVPGAAVNVATTVNVDTVFTGGVLQDSTPAPIDGDAILTNSAGADQLNLTALNGLSLKVNNKSITFSTSAPAGITSDGSGGYIVDISATSAVKMSDLLGKIDELAGNTDATNTSQVLASGAIELHTGDGTAAVNFAGSDPAVLTALKLDSTNLQDSTPAPVDVTTGPLTLDTSPSTALATGTSPLSTLSPAITNGSSFSINGKTISFFDSTSATPPTTAGAADPDITYIDIGTQNINKVVTTIGNIIGPTGSATFDATGKININTGTNMDLSIKAGTPSALASFGLTAADTPLTYAAPTTNTRITATAALKGPANAVSTGLPTAMAAGDTIMVNGKTIQFYDTTATPPVPAGPADPDITYLDVATSTVDDVLGAIDDITGTQSASGVVAGKVTLVAGTDQDLVVSGSGLAKLGLPAGTTPKSTAPTSGLTGLTLTVGATGNSTAPVTIVFGTDDVNGEVSTLDELNAQLMKNNVQASISSSGAITLTTVNDSASADLGVIGGTITDPGNPFAGIVINEAVTNQDSQTTRAGLVRQYNNIIDQIRTTAQDSSFNGVNLLNGDSLKLVFNETGTSTLNVTGNMMDADGLGLGMLTAGADFIDNASTNKIMASLNSASTYLRAQASNLGSNLSVVQIRQDFSKNLINVLQTGSTNLTIADTNEEAANSQALSTRQSIAVSALALANQSQQSVLQLLR